MDDVVLIITAILALVVSVASAAFIYGERKSREDLAKRQREDQERALLEFREKVEETKAILLRVNSLHNETAESLIDVKTQISAVKIAAKMNQNKG